MSRIRRRVARVADFKAHKKCCLMYDDYEGSNEISQPTKPIIDDNSDTEISSRDSDSDEQPSSTILDDYQCAVEEQKQSVAMEKETESKTVKKAQDTVRSIKSTTSDEPGKSSKRHRWTPREVTNLLDGVENFGVGRWTNIYINYYFLPCRDPVSLKDKWRNMLKNKEVPKKYLRN